MDKKKMKILGGLAFTILSLVLISFIFINSNPNVFSGNTSSIESAVDIGSESSLQEVLDNNNHELLKLVDTRKTLIFALYGIDGQSTETGRSDVIMVVIYDPSQKKLVMASLPRDLRVNIPGYGLDKINHAYAYGGRELSDQTIEDLLGIQLDFSVSLDFDTFSKIIDDVGGVNVNVKKNFYNNANSLVIKEGNQVLNGEDALFYVRFRSDEEVDFGRISRQQELIKSLIETLSSSTLKEKISLVNTYYNKGLETNGKLSKIAEYINMSSGDQNITYENYRLNTYSEIIDGLWYELYTQEDLDFFKSLFSNKGELNQENWD